MNDDPISETRLAEIAAVLDEDIDTSDIPEADEAWFRGARLVLPENTLQNYHTVTTTTHGRTPSASEHRRNLPSAGIP